MTTCYCFRSGSDPDLRGFTEDPTGSKLPSENGPWTLEHKISADEEWPASAAPRRVVLAGLVENGFLLWTELHQEPSSRPIIESDRVEGPTVFDLEGRDIGTIKRLLIEKVSGRVVYVDITFGGFLGLGSHHHTIPWHKLRYDTELSGYRTDITEAQLRAAPSFYDDDRAWPDRIREQATQDYWQRPQA